MRGPSLWEDLSCTICLEVCTEPKKCKQCKKFYCKDCINDWKKRNNTCPNCCQENFTLIEATEEENNKFKKFAETQGK